jgi:sorting nexin-29
LRRLENLALRHTLFIDFSSAYDSINRNQLFAAMEEFINPDKLARLVKAAMENIQCQVKVQTELSDPLRDMNGLRQGDSLACIALEKGIWDSSIQTRGTILYKSVQILAFADNLDVIGRSEDDIKKSFMALKTAADAMGLRVNEEKTKYMIVNGKKIHRTAEY